MECISHDNGVRCTYLRSPGSKFCHKHADKHINLYKKYKSVDKSDLSNPIKNDNVYSLMRLHNRLEITYNLRSMYMKVAIHPEFHDEGHKKRLRLVKDKMSECLTLLSDRFDYLIKHNIEDSVPIPLPLTGKVVSILPKNKPIKSPAIKEVNRKISKSVDENKILDNLLLSEQKIIDKSIKLLVSKLSNIIGTTIDKRFLFFLLYDLFLFLGDLTRIVCQSSPIFVKTSPLIKKEINPRVYDRLVSEYLTVKHKKFAMDITDNFELMPTLNKDVYQYLYKLYLYCIEKGHMIFRFYRSENDSYTFTFISDLEPKIFKFSYSPSTDDLELKIEGLGYLITNYKIDFMDPKEEIASDLPGYAGFRTKWGNRYVLVDNFGFVSKYRYKLYNNMEIKFESISEHDCIMCNIIRLCYNLIKLKKETVCKNDIVDVYGFILGPKGISLAMKHFNVKD